MCFNVNTFLSVSDLSPRQESSSSVHKRRDGMDMPQHVASRTHTLIQSATYSFFQTVTYSDYLALRSVIMVDLQSKPSLVRT